MFVLPTMYHKVLNLQIDRIGNNQEPFQGGADGQCREEVED